MTYTFVWRVVLDHLGYILGGLTLTALVTVAALLIGLLIGLVLGMASLSRRPYLLYPTRSYIEVFRNTPVLVQLIWVYYCLPLLVGVDLDAITSCTLALGLNEGAYMAEIFRAGIQSVQRGEVEAARSLGFSHLQTMRYVILPQATRRMIPPFVNQLVTLIKGSSLVSVLGVADLLYRARVLTTTLFRPIELLTAVAVIYLVICWAISACARRLEVRLAVRD